MDRLLMLNRKNEGLQNSNPAKERILLEATSCILHQYSRLLLVRILIKILRINQKQRANTVSQYLHSTCETRILLRILFLQQNFDQNTDDRAKSQIEFCALVREQPLLFFQNDHKHSPFFVFLSSYAIQVGQNSFSSTYNEKNARKFVVLSINCVTE